MFDLVLHDFLAIWTDEKIRKERLSWRCHEARDFAARYAAGQHGASECEVREKIYRSFGAPGDFGYGTPEGQILRKLYELTVSKLPTTKISIDDENFEFEND